MGSVVAPSWIGAPFSVPATPWHTGKDFTSLWKRAATATTVICKATCFQDFAAASPSCTQLPTISDTALPVPWDDTSMVHAVAGVFDTTTYDAHETSKILAEEYMKGVIIADLDAGSAKLAIGVVGPFLSALGFLFVLRIVMSWYPKLPVGKFPYVIAYAPTEPLLIPTRKLIPPLGGVDVTPVVWFGLVSFLNEILVGPQGILVLLSQQV